MEIFYLDAYRSLKDNEEFEFRVHSVSGEAAYLFTQYMHNKYHNMESLKHYSSEVCGMYRKQTYISPPTGEVIFEKKQRIWNAGLQIYPIFANKSTEKRIEEKLYKKLSEHKVCVERLIVRNQWSVANKEIEVSVSNVITRGDRGTIPQHTYEVEIELKEKKIDHVLINTILLEVVNGLSLLKNRLTFHLFHHIRLIDNINPQRDHLWVFKRALTQVSPFMAFTDNKACETFTKMQYFFAEKTNGVRRLMVITSEGIFLCGMHGFVKTLALFPKDRNCIIWEMGNGTQITVMRGYALVRLTHAADATAGCRRVPKTGFDNLILLDVEEEATLKRITIFDILRTPTHPRLRFMNFEERKCIYTNHVQVMIPEWQIVNKQWRKLISLNEVGDLLEATKNNDQTDGIILQPNTTYNKRSIPVLKIKAPHIGNTIDVLVPFLPNQTTPVCDITQHTTYQGKLEFASPQPAHLSNMVVECTSNDWKRKPIQLQPIGIRYDKALPNPTEIIENSITLTRTAPIYWRFVKVWVCYWHAS
jgi:hypothetical protein